MEQFIPPQYKETTHVIFEKKTGNVLATRKFWTLPDDKAKSKRSDHPDFIKVIASDFKKHHDELDSIVLEYPEASEGPIKKIDVKSMKPVFYKKAAAKPKKGIIPERLNSP